MYYKDYRFWVNNSLTKLRHCLSLHFCLILFGPPNFFISCQSKKKKLCIKQSKGGNSFNMSVWYAYQHIWNKYVYITMTSYNGTCSNKLIFITNSFELFIWICDSKILSIFKGVVKVKFCGFFFIFNVTKLLLHMVFIICRDVNSQVRGTHEIKENWVTE